MDITEIYTTCILFGLTSLVTRYIVTNSGRLFMAFEMMDVIVSGDGRLWAETVHPPTPVLDASGRGQVPRPPWRINPATWPGGNPPEGRRALGEAMDAVRLPE